VSHNTTLVPSLGLHIGPACEAGLSAGMRRERVPPQIRKKERKKERKTHRIWRYSYLNFFALCGLKCLFMPPNWGFGGLWTPKCDYLSTRPSKGTSLRKSASFKLSTVKIRWGVWPVCELTESVTDTHRQTDRQTHTHKQVNLYSVHA